MAANHAVVLLLNKMLEHLTVRMKEEIPDDDPTQADIVKIGLLTDSKTRKNIQLGIMAGDHDNPEELDGIVTLDKLPDIGMIFPAREIGGGQMWMRRGIVKIECFFIKERLTEAEATQRAYEVMGRLTQAIEETPIAEIPRDSFGERIITLHCYASTFFETGGPPTSYIFRGKALWAAFTEKTQGIQFI